MSGEVNMIPTLRKFRGGPVQANLGGASLETFSGEGQLKKSPCKSKTRESMVWVKWIILDTIHGILEGILLLYPFTALCILHESNTKVSAK